MQIEIKNYINGELVAAANGATAPFYNPARKTVLGSYPLSTPDDVQAAVSAAAAAFPAWSMTSVDTRHDYLSAISHQLTQQLAELARAESLNTGKPLSLSSSVDIPRSASNFDFFANAITQFASESHDMPHESAINYTLRRPLGVVGCISPWNLPLYLFTWKIAPALAAGNTVVAKPSEVTPLTAFLLSKICIEIGLPKGVLNIIHGLGQDVGEPMVTHPLVKAISFTGSTAVGKRIAALAAPQLKKVSLELGGKNATIILDDCELEKTVLAAVRSSFRNQGQICLCGSRLLVQRGVYDEFKSKFVAAANQLRVGDPFDAATDMGSVVSAVHYEKIVAAIQQAQAEGGTLLCGGTSFESTRADLAAGYFLPPTVIEQLPMQCKTNQEEIFGPVVTLTPFDTLEEAVALANDSPYGLSASVWTQNLSHAHRIANALQTGIVWINTWMLRDLRTPFGGVKQSGIGREGGWEALRFFTEPKNVCIKYS